MNLEKYLRNIIAPDDWSKRWKKKIGEGKLYIGNLSTLRDDFHKEGWYNIIFENDIVSAKQNFYVCGLLNEATNKAVGHLKVNHSRGNTNANALNGYFTTLDVMLSDNRELLLRRTKLSYPEREANIFKDKYVTVIINEIIFSVIDENIERFQILFPLLNEVKKAKNYYWDIIFFEGLLEKNVTKMQEAIEKIGSPEIHFKRQKFKIDDYSCNWENSTLSMYGITYTKLAWILGYELDIIAPLVRIASGLFPVKPLEKYDEIYDFLKKMPDPLIDWY